MHPASVQNVSSDGHPASKPDFMPPAELRALQSSRLRKMVKRAYQCVPVHRRRMDELEITPRDIHDIDDIARLPFTCKSDLRDTYPFGMFASPLSEVVRLHASSGTTGKPIVVGYTQADLQVWANVIHRALVSYGLHAADIVQNAYGYGLFTGGLGIHYGVEALGATVLPISGGNTERQIMAMKDFGVSAVCCTPSYFLHILDCAEELGVDLRELPLRVGCFGAEPWTDAMRRRIETTAGIKAFDIYGLTEIIGPGVGAECCCQNGLHIFEDHFYPEIIDPRSLEPLPDGREGELVLTTLSKQAMPMIRYRTRDITSLVAEPCVCGRTIRRIRRISRRSDDMLIVRGVNVFPSQIETAILAVEGTLPHYEIRLTRHKDLDQIEVRVEVTSEVFGDRVGTLENLQSQLAARIERVIGLRAAVRLVERHSLERSQSKAQRVVDLRER
jgi:phenylacetate-CoA ligase